MRGHERTGSRRRSARQCRNCHRLVCVFAASRFSLLSPTPPLRPFLTSIPLSSLFFPLYDALFRLQNPGAHRRRRNHHGGRQLGGTKSQASQRARHVRRHCARQPLFLLGHHWPSTEYWQAIDGPRGELCRTVGRTFCVFRIFPSDLPLRASDMLTLLASCL